MNISDLNCPQYVCFESTNFQSNLRDTPNLSVDSLNTSEHAESENLSMISGNLSSLCTPSDISENYNKETLHLESTRYNCDETTDVDQENLGDLSNQTENFPLLYPKFSSGTVKCTTLKTTVPKPFQFHTDNRVKSKPANEISKYEKKDFVSELRQNIVTQSHKNRHTKQQPFNLTEAKKRKRDADYLPLAEQIKAFHQKTPDRFHSSSNKEFQPQKHWNPPKLVAKTPKLQSFKRRRVVEALSREEQENKEIEEMKAYEFHAKPVDPKIYRQPPISKSQPMTKTKPKDFRLKTTQRALMQLRNRTLSNKEKYKFKARPIPKAILNGPTGLKQKQVIRVTEAKSPSFAIEDRLEKRKIHEQEKKIQEELLQKKARKKKDSSAPIAPSVPFIKKRTEIQPFSFDKADKERFSQKERKIQEEIERESKPFVFHAQLMPGPEPSPLPVVQKLPPTEVKPFNFLLENRSSKSSNLTFEVANTTFKAQPATVLKREPFIPEKPPKQIIEIKEFNLHTDKRASDRQHLKEIKEQEELLLEQALAEQRAKEEEMERLELIRLRREIVHKANPIRQYKPVELQPSSQPLTFPESPKFETDKRIQKRHDPSI